MFFLARTYDSMVVSEKSRRGVTLIEVLVVLAILAMVAAMLTRGIVSGRESAKLKQAYIIANGTLKTAIISYLSNQCPTGINTELAAALDKFENSDQEKVGISVFLEREKEIADAAMVKDPWGNDFKVTFPPIGPDLAFKVAISLNSSSTRLVMPKVEFNMKHFI